MIEKINKEIDEQIESIKYLQNHPEIAKLTIMRETEEYCRGALSMLNYLKTFIKYNT